MEETLPLLPLSDEQFQRLIALMLTYHQYCQRQPGISHRRMILAVLSLLLPRLYQGMAMVNTGTPLLLLVDEVQVIKWGIATILTRLKKKASSSEIQQEIQQTEELKNLFEQTFRTTQD